MNFLYASALNASGGFPSLKEIWKAFHDTYLSDQVYENLALDSNSMISVRAIIIGFFVGIALALFVSVYHKRFLGELVRTIRAGEIHSPELAKTLPELGLADRLLLRRAVKKSVSLRRVLRCREEEEFYAAQEEKASAQKKYRIPNFRVDPDAHHFYIPEDLKYTAELKFDKKGTSTGALIFFLVLVFVFMIVALIVLPQILHAVDALVGGLKSATSSTNNIV